MSRRGALLLGVLSACSDGEPAPPRPVTPATEAPARPRCAEPVPLYAGGRLQGSVCPGEEAGLTIVELDDDWAPVLFHGQDYAATYVALANERFGKGDEWDRAKEDRFLELYGITPSLGVTAARLLEAPRHACHLLAQGAVDPVQGLRRNLRIMDKVQSAPSTIVAAIERRMICEGLLPPSAKPRPRWRVELALEQYQRRHAVVSHAVIDGETRRTLAADSRELDFRALLRSLRARVVDATGLIEDGSALSARGLVVGRAIDGAAFYATGGRDPLPHGAPDRVSMATDAAARALGWTDPQAAAAFFRAGHLPRRVALRLPPAPRYHSPHMELRAEIDRGDVWYELPGRRGRIEDTPTLTLYARDVDGGEVALVRWPTTIGGWKKELGKWGNVGLKFKESDVGPRIWRDLVVTPAWLPPPKTPPRTLVRSAWPDRWVADTDLVGPGYASAYGLVMLVHHKPFVHRGVMRFADNGIRTHGTVSYQSILRGESHGCHRLFNQSAVQLSSFLLRHRLHLRHGLVDKPFVRLVPWKGRTVRLPIPHRGYRIELMPPVAVNVLPGDIKGRWKRPPPRMVGLPQASAD